MDGLRPLCSLCQRAYERIWRSKNKERLRKARWIRSPKAKLYSRLYRAKNRARYLLAECRRRCAREGWEFDLDENEIQARINVGRCEVTGYPLNSSPLTVRYERRPDSPSLDRINPKLGYTKKNVRVVCLAVNLAMSNWGELAVAPIIAQWASR